MREVAPIAGMDIAGSYCQAERESEEEDGITTNKRVRKRPSQQIPHCAARSLTCALVKRPLYQGLLMRGRRSCPPHPLKVVPVPRSCPANTRLLSAISSHARPLILAKRYMVQSNSLRCLQILLSTVDNQVLYRERRCDLNPEHESNTAGL